MGGRRAADDARASMSSVEYLAAHDLRRVWVHALVYVSASCAGDLDAEASPVFHIGAASEYFHAVATAKHVVGRPFDFVRVTICNRAAFHLAVHRVLESVCGEGGEA